MIGFLIGLVFVGLIVGALGRLAIPGPNPMSIGVTILVGIGGSFLAGIVSAIIFGRETGSLLLAVAGAALIVWLLQRREGGRRRR